MKIYTTVQLSIILKCHPRLVLGLIAKKKLKPIVFAGKFRFTEQSLLKSLRYFFVGSKYGSPESFPTDFINSEEAAKIFGQSRLSVLRWTRKREIPFYRFGKHTIRFREIDILSTMNKNRKAE